MKIIRRTKPLSYTNKLTRHKTYALQYCISTMVQPISVTFTKYWMVRSRRVSYKLTNNHTAPAQCVELLRYNPEHPLCLLWKYV